MYRDRTELYPTCNMSAQKALQQSVQRLHAGGLFSSIMGGLGSCAFLTLPYLALPSVSSVSMLVGNASPRLEAKTIQLTLAGGAARQEQFLLKPF